MRASLQALLEQVIDYAGLFPPAALPLEAAAAEYSELRRSDNAWLLRRFVCPVNWLSDLLPLIPEGTQPAWSISVLGTALEGSRQDLALIEKFELAAGTKAAVESYEVKANLSDINPGILRHLSDSYFDEVFIELDISDALNEGLQKIAEVEGIGAKLRSGGLKAEAFPSSKDFASWLHEAISLDLQYKCTAGLHHPMPFHDESIGARHHGFINVLAASVLIAAHDLTRNEAAQILDAENSADFWFSDQGMGFRDWEADIDQITMGREYMISIGSCSVAEPVEGLQALGLQEAGR